MNTATLFPEARTALPGSAAVAWLRTLLRRREPVAAVRLATRRHALAARTSVWEDQPQGLEIVCEQGAVWLTFDHDRRDVVLAAGQSHRCTRAERLGIYALEASQLVVR